MKHKATTKKTSREKNQNSRQKNANGDLGSKLSRVLNVSKNVLNHICSVSARHSLLRQFDRAATRRGRGAVPPNCPSCSYIQCSAHKCKIQQLRSFFFKITIRSEKHSPCFLWPDFLPHLKEISPSHPLEQRSSCGTAI